jgi:hypothetical protein
VQPVGGVVSFDVRRVVVDEFVVSSAQEDLVADLGFVVGDVFRPGVDVVGFAVGGWSVAAGIQAAAVSFGEGPFESPWVWCLLVSEAGLCRLG